LTALSVHLFESLGFVEHFNLDAERLVRFFSVVEKGYGESPYHNSTHASSVLHLLHSMLTLGGLLDVVAAKLDAEPKLVHMACLFAAAVHDYDHHGVSNDFHVNTASDRALRYNDKAVNEQHHIAAAFEVLAQSECNFLEALDAKDLKKLRRLAIQLVLATDMADHGATMKAFKDLCKSSEGEQGKTGSVAPESEEQAILLLKVAMKCADLGHLTLDWDDHVSWVERLEREFFAQGDREKDLDLSVSFLMDREKPGASETQVGFFDFVVLPLFRIFIAAAPGAEPLLDGVLENYTEWQELEGTPVARRKSDGDSLHDSRRRPSARKRRATLCGADFRTWH